MKKLFALLLCFIMMFTFAGCGSVSPGEVIKVPVELTKNPGMAAAQFTIEYNADKLTFLGYNNGTILEECQAHHETGKIKVVLVKDFTKSMDDATAKGTLLTLKFQVKENALKGKTSFKVSETQFVKVNEQEVEATIQIADLKIK